MKEFTMHKIQNLYCNLRDKLTITEREEFKRIIDELTWTKYEKEMVEGF
jgi:hypothetical protein